MNEIKKLISVFKVKAREVVPEQKEPEVQQQTEEEEEEEFVEQE